jgi:hypothetical protein
MQKSVAKTVNTRLIATVYRKNPQQLPQTAVY